MALGWSPSEFWRSTWHDLTSHWVANEEMKKALNKPRPGEHVDGGTLDINDDAALDRIFTKRTKPR